MRLLLTALVAAAIATSACAAHKSGKPSEGWRQIVIDAAPAAPTAAGVGARFGDLYFRGGLKLTSDDPKFGGWSGLRLDPNGNLIGLSDEGSWLSFRPQFDPKTGVLIGVSDAKMAPLTDLDGVPLRGKEESDSEGLARLPDGRYAVSFEHHHRIRFYDLDGAGPQAPAQPGPPVKTRGLRPNQGLEALTSDAAGELVAGSEIPPRGQKTSHFYLYRLDAPLQKSFVEEGPAETSRGNALVDMDLLPDGDLVALERFFFPFIGFRTAIRRYYAAGLHSAHPALNGPLLASFASPENIDNFEGIAAEAEPNGGTLLFIISDDNFRRSQQTLLYAFELPAQKNG